MRRHLCRKTNPHFCRKTNPTGAKLKIYLKESTCRSFGSWFMVYIRSSNQGDQETNYEARNESVVSKFCTSHLKFRPPSRFFFWRGRDTSPNDFRRTWRQLLAAERYITWGPCDDCLSITIRRWHSNLLSWCDYYFLAGERPRTFTKHISRRMQVPSFISESHSC